MRERISSEIERHRGEVARLEIELELIGEAQNRPRRRSRTTETATRTASSGRARNGGLPRDQLFSLIVEYGKPAHPAELSAFLETKGIHVAPKALHTGMTRLEKRDGKLVKLDPSVWGLPEWANGSRGNAADDPLFRDDERQSQDSRRASES